MDMGHSNIKITTAMRIPYFITTMILVIFGCAYNENNKGKTSKQSNEEVKTEQDNGNPWDIILIKGQTIYFRNEESINTHLYDLSYIGQLPTKKKAPYLIMAGRSCENCDENISIYIHSPTDGEMKSYGKQPRYSYPGKTLDFATNELVFESRMYYGDCLRDYQNSVAWNQKFLNSQNEWEQSTFIVQVYNDTLREINIVDKTIFNEVQKGVTCQEVEGIEMVSEP